MQHFVQGVSNNNHNLSLSNIAVADGLTLWTLRSDMCLVVFFIFRFAVF